MIVPTASNGILLLILGAAFVHFMIAGGRTFHFEETDKEGPGAYLAQFSFLVSGTMLTWAVGLRMPMPVVNQTASALLLVASLALYEWARHTIWGRRFGIALGNHVPAALCEAGPYRYIRHPIYLSYVFAFLAVLVALPHWATALSFLANLAVFVVTARSDERVLADSPLAADYAVYRRRTGMFFPKFSSAAPGRWTP
jgi:protein-S-isoprenylcysteine O-methyltransferase Ste14